MPRISLDDPRDYLDWREGSGGTVEIADIVVGSERRRGRGRRLIETLLAQVQAAPTVWAITRAGNEIAQQFYESLGFRVIGVLRRFYGEALGVDAILYGRSPRGPV